MRPKTLTNIAVNLLLHSKTTQTATHTTANWSLAQMVFREGERPEFQSAPAGHVKTVPVVFSLRLDGSLPENQSKCAEARVYAYHKKCDLLSPLFICTFLTVSTRLNLVCSSLRVYVQDEPRVPTQIVSPTRSESSDESEQLCLRPTSGRLVRYSPSTQCSSYR